MLDERVYCSLGILKIAAVLEARGYGVEVLDLSGVSNFAEAMATHAKMTEAEVFGITATSPQMPATKKIVEVIRDTRPDAKIILGGPHATLVCAAVKKEKARAEAGRATRALEQLQALVGVLVTGDGEDAVFQALAIDRGIVDGDDPKGPLFLTSKRLEETPFPARHFVDNDSYHAVVDNEKSCSIIAQLGCCFSCGFCAGRSSPSLRRIRTRSTESVLREIEQLNRDYGFRGFMCYDNTTEILTENRGFVKFSDLLLSDAVATLNPKTNELFFEVPKRVVKLPFNGNLITVSNRLIDLAVTPDHRMWLKNGEDAIYEHVSANRLSREHTVYFLQRAEWSGVRRSTFSIPAYNSKFLGRGKGSPKVRDGMRVFPAAIWVQFMAWYLAEGSCYRPKIKRKGKEKGRGYRICIKQSQRVNPENVAEINSVLNALGYKHSYSSDQFHIDSKELYEYLYQFGTSHKKHMPPEFKNMTPELLLLFLMTYLKGDGCRQKSSGQESIVSFSDRMRDDLQEIAIKCGYWAALDKRHRVLLSKQRDLVVNSIHGEQNDVGRVGYCGDVHCVTVSTGVILVRRNGKAVWCGNCYDDELNVNKGIVELMNGIADLGKRLNVDFRFRGFVKSELFTEEQAEAMYRAGFRWLLCGFESGSSRILENINKKADREDNDRCVEIAHKYGIKVKALMSIGHPGESAKTIQDTEDWLLKAKPDDFDVTIITPYPGSPYFDDAVETAPGVWTYTCPKSGDRLHADAVDYLETADFYKGSLGAYVSHVFTDYISKEDLVTRRDAVEKRVREVLGIPYNAGAPGIQFEASMGQTKLPPTILRESVPVPATLRKSLP